ncbi:MAG: universal stress protein [Humidesulfovibrio sp.]|nr:universal stress protein [Humidesulfovibrio sp.]
MKILAAYDGSNDADKALGRAIDIAKKFEAELTVLYVVPELILPAVELSADYGWRLNEAFEKEAKHTMTPVVERVACLPIAAKVLIEQGDPIETILDTAEASGADLIILGSRGRHGAKRMLLGSVSATVCEHAKCDVLIVK